MVITQQVPHARSRLSWARWMRHLRAVHETFRVESRGQGQERFESIRANYAMTRGDRIGLVALAGLLAAGCLFFVIVGGWFGLLIGLYGIAWQTWLLLSGAHQGVMSTDGEIRFRGLHREWRCHAEDVRRVAVKCGEGGPMWFAIRTPSGTARLSYSAARPMVDAILAANPAVTVRGYRPGHAGRRRGLSAR